MLPQDRAQALAIPCLKRLKHFTVIVYSAIPFRNLEVRAKPQRLQSSVHRNIGLPKRRVASRFVDLVVNRLIAAVESRWIDNYNYGDSPVGPPANLQGASPLLSDNLLGTSVVCSDCHFSAGLIDGTVRGILIVYRLLQNPVVRYGIGQGARKAAENWDRIKQMCKPAAETELEGIPPGRITSKYENKTEGNSITNVETDVTKAEFEANLRNDGWTQTVSKDGKADIFTKDGERYTVRDESNAGSPTADFTPAGASRATLKIRLPKP